MGRHAQYLHGCLALRRCHPLQPQSPLWSETGCYRNETMRCKGRIQCSWPKQAQTSFTSCRRLLLARAWQVESSGGCDGFSRKTCAFSRKTFGGHGELTPILFLINECITGRRTCGGWWPKTYQRVQCSGCCVSLRE